MDKTRKAKGNDKPWNGKKAVTYYHFVLSPDPKDHVDLPTLKKLANRWVEENFPDSEVAIVYHDDNENNIPHAHVVVNNTDLRTGKRVQISNEMNERQLPNSLNRISYELGLTPMPDLNPGKGAPAKEPVTLQHTYLTKTERGMRQAAKNLDKPATEKQMKYLRSLVKRGLIPAEELSRLIDTQAPTVSEANALLNKYAPRLDLNRKNTLPAKRNANGSHLSWKEEIRLQIIEITRQANGPLTFEQFKTEMQTRGYDVWQNKRGGYTYQHKDEVPNSAEHKHWQVKDRKLGFAYTPAGMAHFYKVGAELPQSKEMFHKLTAYQTRRYNAYVKRRSQILQYLSPQERLAAIKTLQDENIGHLSDFAPLRESLLRERNRLNAQLNNLNANAAVDEQLRKAIADYRDTLSVVNRLNSYAQETASGRVFYNRYKQAHGAEIDLFATSRDFLEAHGVKDMHDIERVEERLASKEQAIADVKADLHQVARRITDIDRASWVCDFVVAADKQAQKDTAVRYAPRNPNKKPKGAEYNTYIREKVSIRSKQDAEGRQRYAVRHSRDVFVGRASATTAASNRAWNTKLQREAQARGARPQVAEQQQHDERNVQQRQGKR